MVLLTLIHNLFVYLRHLLQDCINKKQIKYILYRKKAVPLQALASIRAKG